MLGFGCLYFSSETTEGQKLGHTSQAVEPGGGGVPGIHTVGLSSESEPLCYPGSYGKGTSGPTQHGICSCADMRLVHVVTLVLVYTTSLSGKSSATASGYQSDA